MAVWTIGLLHQPPCNGPPQGDVQSWYVLWTALAGRGRTLWYAEMPRFHPDSHLAAMTSSPLALQQRRAQIHLLLEPDL